MNISKRIKDIRESKGLKQSEMSERLEMEQANYSYLERKGDKLTIEQLKQIAEALEVTLQEILFEDVNDIPNLEFAQLQQENKWLKKNLEEKDKRLTLLEEMVDLLKKK